MVVHVDEPRGEHQIPTVDPLHGRLLLRVASALPPDLHDPAVVDADRGREGGCTGAVDDGGRADHEVEHGGHRSRAANRVVRPAIPILGPQRSLW